MTRTASLACFAICLATPLTAQTVVTEPVLDPVQIELRDELYRLRDTLTLVEGATAVIARDIGSSSDQVLRSRARTVSERCKVAASVVPPARILVTERARPMPDPRKHRAQLTSALEELEVKLTECTTEFAGLATPDRSKELRDYGIGRGAKLREAVRAFDLALGIYFPSAIGTRYMPKAGRTGGVIP